MAFLTKNLTYGSSASQISTSAAPGTIGSTAQIKHDAPDLRSPAHLRVDAQRRAPAFPGVHFTESTAGGARQRKALKPFLPAMDFREYANAKKQAGIHAATPKPTLSPKVSTGNGAAVKPVAPPLAPVGLISVFEGAANVDGESPPDTHGSIGATEFVEVTNSHINIYDKSNPTNSTSTALSAFFGYFTQGAFDPRAIYDSTWNRWIITADAFPESATTQFFLFAISQTSSAFGSFYIYKLNVTFNSGDFWDFPQVGMDQDAVIFTANVFDTNGNLRGADMFAVAKARLYNGGGFSVPVFQGLVSTLTPPNVIDQNANTYLIAAPPSGTALQLYTLTNSSHAYGMSLSSPQAVSVNQYNIPPPAPQPGLSDPADLIDTGDCRFVNASTQIGDNLWQTHTVALGSFSAPKFYQISVSTATVVQSNFYLASGTSFDFNASIAANANNDVFVNWSSTDPPNNVNAQVRFAGSVGVGGANFFPGAGTAAFTSSAGITGDFDPRFGLQRWGDYSAVTIDPDNIVQAWIVNETINDANDWGSVVAVIG